MAKDIEKINLGQYFTPQNIVDFMVSLTQAQKLSKILEPSCGDGIFLKRLQSEGFKNLLGIEVDKELIEDSSIDLINESFVSWKSTSKFSLVIGNPPYVRWKNLSDWQKQELKESQYFGTIMNSLSDYLTIFIAKSVDLLEEGGELIFITPSYWFQTMHSSKLRDWLIERGSFNEIVFFAEDKIFPNVNSSLIIFRYIKKLSDEQIKFYKFKSENEIKNLKIDLTDADQFVFFTKPQFKKNSEWILSDEQSQTIANQLESYCQVDNGQMFEGRSISTLGDYVDIANGMVSGLDEAFKLNPIDLASLTTAESEALFYVIKSKDLENLMSNSTSYYINIPSNLEEKKVRSIYPNFIKKLEMYREKLENRYSYGRQLPFWEWAFKRSEKYFLNNKSKIIVPCKERVTNKDLIRFSWLEPNHVALQDVTALSMKEQHKESNEYLLAYLNHPQVSNWIRNKGIIKGGIAEFSEKPIKRIPFRRINWSNTKEVVLHDNITKITKSIIANKFVDQNQKSDLNLLLDELFKISIH